MNYRRAAKQEYIEGVEVATVTGFLDIMREADVWINL